MRLLHVTTLRLSLFTGILLALWSVFFYFSMMDEVYDEIDDSLEDYAEIIITRSLRGESLPTNSNGTNNYYFLHKISESYAQEVPHVRYEDKEIKLDYKNEIEPARVLSYIFMHENGQYYELVVATPNIDKDDLRQNITYWILFLFMMLLVSIVLVNFWGIRRSMRPLKIMLQWLDNYHLGQNNQPLNNPTNILEFCCLNKAITQSMERGKELYEQQKVFIGNASHEMQTPIAACQNRIEMLLEDEELGERQMGELVKVNQTLRQLSRLNKSLLMLCKIENGQYAHDMALDLTTCLEKVLPDFESVYAYRKISTTLEVVSPFITEIDENLADILLSNLIKNAYVHNVNGGCVRIMVSKSSIKIANTGNEQALDSQKIFQRFYHTTQQVSSNGLGLALVEAICKRYHLLITYQYEGNMHIFEITK